MKPSMPKKMQEELAKKAAEEKKQAEKREKDEAEKEKKAKEEAEKKAAEAEAAKAAKEAAAGGGKKKGKKSGKKNAAGEEIGPDGKPIKKSKDGAGADGDEASEDEKEELGPDGKPIKKPVIVFKEFDPLTYKVWNPLPVSSSGASAGGDDPIMQGELYKDLYAESPFILS